MRPKTKAATASVTYASPCHLAVMSVYDTTYIQTGNIFRATNHRDDRKLDK